MPNTPASDLPASNVTRAGITGKVPKTALRRGRKGRKAKPARLSADQRSHVKQLAKAGRISPSAAKSHGLQGKP